MTQTIEELADYIVNEIEKEDFYYALKHYGCYKIEKTAKELKQRWRGYEDYFN